ncbi:hypothetical protein [Deinococcus misasensis]|uniref:hypothetical protein n=1 Tax=Deinococcus misasensis TaxID=392413 RepID=UPI0012FB791F|nr:hypothetical protein [Deinococcus misasensis]
MGLETIQAVFQGGVYWGKPVSIGENRVSGHEIPYWSFKQYTVQGECKVTALSMVGQKPSAVSHQLSARKKWFLPPFGTQKPVVDLFLAFCSPEQKPNSVLFADG